jgi:hypothetical protein
MAHLGRRDRLLQIQGRHHSRNDAQRIQTYGKVKMLRRFSLVFSDVTPTATQ